MSISTRLYTLLKGDLVGADEFGNRYYRSKGPKLNGRERRWVLYRGKAEPSKVPGEWHAWLHHTSAAPLSEKGIQPKAWQKEHLPNLTGTINAYHPKGHPATGAQRQHATGDYQAWQPE